LGNGKRRLEVSPAGGAFAAVGVGVVACVVVVPLMTVPGIAARTPALTDPD